MLTMTIKQALAHRMRLTSTAVAVLLGVMLMSGTLIFTDTLTATFDGVVTDANAGVDVMVRAQAEMDVTGGQSGVRIDASVADTLRSADGVADAATIVTGYAQLVGSDGEAIGDQEQAPTLGRNWVDQASLNPYVIDRGQPPTADDEIVIDRGTATQAGYDVGDIATVLTTAAPREFHIAGIATFGTAESAGGANVILFTDATAQQLLSTAGQVDGIVVHATEGVSQDDLAEQLQAMVADDIEVVTGDVLVAEDRAAFQASFGPFKVFLMVFAIVAMFVGAFMINNTFSITVAQRTQQLAMLRAVGASRRQVLRSVMVEAVVIGVLGSATGIALGVAIAIGLRALVTAAGAELPDGAMVVTASSMLATAAMGMTVTLVSAWLPARRAGRVPPIAALRELAVDRSGSSAHRTVAGTLVTVTGMAALLAGLSGAGLQFVGLGALVALVGIAVLAPVVAVPVTRAVGLPLALRGMPGEIALRNAQRNPKRTARTASSLMIGVALVVFIAILAASVKTSFGGSLETTFLGTHVLDSGSFEGVGGLSDGLADDLRTRPGVQTVVQARRSRVIIAGSDAWLEAFTAGSLADMFDLGNVEGDLSSLGADGMAVDTEHAAEQGWTIGSTVDVTLATGPRTFVVRALFDNGSEWVGKTFVDIAAIEAALPSQLDFRIYATGDDDAIQAAAAPYPSAELLTRGAFLDQSVSEMEAILGVIYALLALAVLTAAMGIANTMALSIAERTRELGLLRAVGMTRSQVRKTVRWEAITIALYGATLGLAIGTFFGWATVRALADEGIEILTMPVGTLAVVTGIAAMAGAVAAMLPARRAARMEVLSALTSQ